MARRATPLSEHVFFLARFTFEGGADEGPLSKLEVEELVQSALRNLFGEFGAAEAVNALRWENGEAILQVAWEAGVNVRAALTLLGEWRGKRCRIDVLRTAAALAQLATSTDYLMSKAHRRLKGTETAQEQLEIDNIMAT